MGSDKKSKKLTSKEKEKLRQLLAQDSDSSEEEQEPQPKKKVHKESDGLSSISENENEEENNESSSEEQPIKQQKDKKFKVGKKQLDGSFLFDLEDPKKKVSVSRFKNKTYVALREYYEKDGDYLPTKKGCSININQWKMFKKIIQEIDSAIQEID